MPADSAPRPADQPSSTPRSEPRTDAGLPFDDRPCQSDCCDWQTERHVHEGTHRDHVGDGKWCIDCDVVIGQPAENVSREAAPPQPAAPPLDVERLGFFELLDIAEEIMRRAYPPHPLLCSRTTAAIGDLIASCRGLAASTKPERP